MLALAIGYIIIALTPIIGMWHKIFVKLDRKPWEAFIPFYNYYIVLRECKQPWYWVFFMLFALSLALVTVTLAALGSDFEEAMVLSIATLSTTGPLIDIASENPIQLAELGNPAKAVLIGAMVLGRLETLAIIALFTPDLWRN